MPKNMPFWCSWGWGRASFSFAVPTAVVEAFEKSAMSGSQHGPHGAFGSPRPLQVPMELKRCLDSRTTPKIKRTYLKPSRLVLAYLSPVLRLPKPSKPLGPFPQVADHVLQGQGEAKFGEGLQGDRGT